MSDPGSGTTRGIPGGGRVTAALLPVAVIGVVVAMVVPMPAAVLDVLLATNIGFGVLLLLSAIGVLRPLELSTFPPVLLVATLVRLALNVSTTRLILLHGDAGRVIDAFGRFVIGGNLVVGLVVFLILVAIQFVVITNGTSRVAEVAARFTLDAMPGKQMAIDSDLAAGVIDDTEARRRRAEISAEADFYGAMDGAAKFTKGDAIAGLVITVINLLGGLAVGVLQQGLGISEAVNRYSLLTVGDGLVSQIPALLVSISAGVLITRAAADGDLGSQVGAQLGAQWRALVIAGGVLAALALVPGLPVGPFLFVGAVFAGAGALARTRATGTVGEPDTAPAPAAPEPAGPVDLIAEAMVDPLVVELAVDLVELAERGSLLERIRNLRSRVARDLGFPVPPVRTVDNPDLEPSRYRILVHGVPVATGELPAGRVLVLGDRPDRVPGQDTVDPVFGVPGRWVPADLAGTARASGLTVVDRESVLVTHLGEVVHRWAARLLDRAGVRVMLDALRRRDPDLVEDLTSAGFGVPDLHAVLRELLVEQVPVRDLVTIVEAISGRWRHLKDPVELAEAVRGELGAQVAVPSLDPDGSLPVLVPDPEMAADMRAAADGDPQAAERVTVAVRDAWARAVHSGERPVLVTDPEIRGRLARLLAGLDGLRVLSWLEVADLTVRVVGQVRAPADSGSGGPPGPVPAGGGGPTGRAG